MTILVALVAMPAQTAASECEALLEEPSNAPSHADREAQWPGDVAISLAEVVKGLTFARSARNRMPLATALAQVEAQCESTEQVPAGLVLQGGEDGHEDGVGDARECVVCMAAPRAVRFGCGHLCCCTACSDTMRDQNMGCPNCRAPIAIATGASSAEPTFIAVGQPLAPVGEE